MTLWERKECTEYNEFNCFEELKGRSNEQKWKTIIFCEINFLPKSRGHKSMFSEPSSFVRFV